ncbi:MAG TPA: peptide ABC transporter substrate-binding protein [Bacillota bacterium]|nr:peptide ABC transporter substrate-binding protein [Bacillota bacterium]
MSRKGLTLLLSLIFTALILAACGGGSDDGEESSTSEEGSSSEEQVLRMHLGDDPTTFDPSLHEDFVTGSMTRQIFDGLVRFGEDGEPTESLAESIDISDDGLTYTFELRESEWTNGDPVTADDFVYSWTRVLSAETASGAAHNAFLIKNGEDYFNGDAEKEDVGVKALDEYTLEVELEYPAPYFLELLTGSQFMPLNEEAVEGNDDWADDPETYVTNGPFSLESYSIQDEVVLVKNDTYWDKDNVQLDRVEYILIEDDNTALDMYETGELDWVGSPLGAIPGDAIKPLLDEGTLQTEDRAHMTAARFNVEKEPFQNEKIRKAFAYALNRADITEHVTQAGEKPALGFVPYTAIVNPDGYFEDNNVEEAQQLLEEGMEEEGYDELPKVTFLYNTNDRNHRLAQTIQAQIKDALDIDIDLEHKEAKVFFEQQNEGDHMFSIAGRSGSFNDGVNFLQNYMIKDSTSNNTNWHNPEYNEFLEEAREEADADARDDLLRKAEEVMMDDMPLTPLFSGVTTWIQDDKVKNVPMTSIGHVDLKYAHIE